jgi:hypothetical protein
LQSALSGLAPPYPLHQTTPILLRGREGRERGKEPVAVGGLRDSHGRGGGKTCEDDANASGINSISFDLKMRWGIKFKLTDLRRRAMACAGERVV